MLDFLTTGARRTRVGFRIRRGLDLSLPGAPRPMIDDGIGIDTVALMVADYPGLRPAMKVAQGDRVAAGDALFADRRRPDLVFTAPVAGTVVRVANRSEPLEAQTVEIVRDGEDARRFETATAAMDRDSVTAVLLESGLWPAFRARPFDRIPDPGETPEAIFVTAMASDPLAGDPAAIIAAHAARFEKGVEVLGCLGDGPVHVCQGPGPALAKGSVVFDGPHPAGLPGTHIHFLHPVDAGGTVWHLDCQDVIAIGRLFAEGEPWRERVVALAGPGVRDPRLCSLPLGANLDELTAGQLKAGDQRVISGSVLSGRRARYLGRYHRQVSVLPEGWDVPAGVFGPIAGPVSTAQKGAPGPLLALDAFERVMPLGLLPVPLLRALSVGDRDAAVRLGCLELVEEDLALMSYVCPGRGEYGPLLRRMLRRIEDQG
ncbi:MAG: NADH:ubiquinone reductase (Na(+)-transporting) subunit A [Alphaproteobacteria bacterium]|nr:NADH:ubiquinone reductase (Na(+)-transporting) subunit A [Alphaproteobacteria bacterium]